MFVDHRGVLGAERAELSLPRPSIVGKLIFATLLTAGMLLTGALSVRTEALRSAQAQTVAAPPARISYIEGDVSFWRPGAAEWTPARINTPLAPGDSLYTGPNGNVEVQIGPRTFLRAAEGTQVGLDNQEAGFVQFRVTAGRASVDVGELAQAQTVELDTPNAAFTLERTGYYRADVTEDSTTFETQRGGNATMTPAGGVASTIAAGRQVMVTGTDVARVEVGPAPELTEWDRWNYQRTDQLVNSLSARYVASGVYGTPELDRYGSWRTVEGYGSVWVPRTVATGWTPYSTGRWIWDPRYGWTWLDDEPWGWAPYHYGRWVHAGGFWGWAPGPIVTRPVYAPALVVFLGGGVRLSVGVPLAWAPLGWGEPIIPWWGRPGYVGRPSWDGWGGPRVVNNVVVKNTTIINVQNITVYRNVTGSSRVNAVVGVAADRFGRADVRPSRFSEADVRQLTPVRGHLAVKPVAASLAPSSGTAIRPPEAIHGRSVVATRPPRDFTPALRAEGLTAPSVATPSTAPRLVPAPRKEAPPARSAVAPSPAPGATPAIGAPTPARPDVRRNKAAEQRPQPPTPPAVVAPQPRREAAPAGPPVRPDAKGDKAAERPQPPTPPAVVTPKPRREAAPAGPPARPDAKPGRAAEQRPQPPTPPAVVTPRAKDTAAPAPVTPPVSQTVPPRTERPNARPAAGQPAEPVVATPEPGQPRGARQ
ncbi:MAG TPA: DUF6600 domain-containing protein [Candidatus Deferrimicrobiaceae bacterium]|nr:DUF6600 domain-containing protein [Candidatus Deferrimicrobiaceae bacterium]